MNPLSLLYGAVSGGRNLIYDTGWFSAHLRVPVVSVGNISVGGTGKTPFILYLGEQLKRRGVRFDVLSRGYGRSSKGVRVVDPAGSPQEFGDEPLLIARLLGAPVVVGESRYHAGLVAEQRFHSQLHLLDDGLQHRQLHRDLDIVLLPEEDLRDELLPAGRLREPRSALSRADIVVANGGAPKGYGGTVLTMKRTMQVESLSGGVVAFCGIARPHGFFSGLRAAGINVVAERAYRDHHRYSEADVHEIAGIRASSGASGFLTTQKDLINLGTLAERLSPLSIARLSVALEKPDLLLDRIAALAAAAKS